MWTELAFLEGSGEETDWGFSGTGGGSSSHVPLVSDCIKGSPRPMGDLLSPCGFRGVLGELLDEDPEGRGVFASYSNSNTEAEADRTLSVGLCGLLGVTTIPRGSSGGV